MGTVFLLGAGASAEGDIPTSHGMVEKILELAESWDGSDAIPRAVNYLVGALIAHFARNGGNPLKYRVDIEDVVTSALTLGRRQDVAIAAFIKGWDERVASFSRMAWPPQEEQELGQLAAKALAPDIDDRFGKYGLGKLSAFDDLVTKVIERQGWMWPQVASWLQSRVVELTGTSREDQFDYLKPLLNYAADSKATIATLNQDDSIEHLSKRLGLPVDLGVSNWQESRVVRLNRSATALLKLHGSCRWGLHLVGKETEEHSLKYEFELNPQNHHMYPLILFGERNKLTAEGPYLELFIEFRRRLFKAKQLTIIGYSFRDEHVNEALGEFLDIAPKAKITIVDVAPRGQREYNLGSWRYSWEERCEFIEATAGEYCKSLA